MCLSHRIADIYARLHQSVDQSDTTADLKWWSDNYGASMTMAWPQYEVNICAHCFNGHFSDKPW